jgi:hypothetical protein
MPSTSSSTNTNMSDVHINNDDLVEFRYYSGNQPHKVLARSIQLRIVMLNASPIQFNCVIESPNSGAAANISQKFITIRIHG